jgi:hypothetical protein
MMMFAQMRLRPPERPGALVAAQIAKLAERAAAFPAGQPRAQRVRHSW